MALKIIGDEVIFSSGRIGYANQGVIGIDSGLETSSGYDDGFYGVRDEVTDAYAAFTKAEAGELADYMINLWKRYKDKHA